jgi:hypothetical protein
MTTTTVQNSATTTSSQDHEPVAAFITSCPTWARCTPEQHRVDQHLSDRVHHSGETMVSEWLELGHGTRWPATDTERGGWEPDRLVVYLAQHYRAAEADLIVSLNDQETLRLTLAEAAVLRSAITTLLMAAAQ